MAKRKRNKMGDHEGSDPDDSSLDEFEKNDKYGSVL